eukprot:6000221-Amphidinium_carterae.1
MYFKEMVEKSQALQGAGKLAENRAPQKTAMKHHSKHFDGLSLEKKMRYSEQAVVHQSASSMSVHERARVKHAELERAQERLEPEESMNESSMLLSSCRLCAA